MEILAIPEIRYLLQVLLAFGLGSLIGLEREYIGKAAGMRTFALVCLATTLFTILSREAFVGLGGPGVEIDPSRVAAGTIVGMGFLGAGIIIFRRNQIEGLTTAAALWCAVAIGIAVGAGFYYLSLIGTLAIFITLTFMRRIEAEHINDERRR